MVRRYIGLFCPLILPLIVQAGSERQSPQAISACLSAAAAYQAINPQVLWAIAYTESRFRTVYNRSNRNRSYDIGVMQINSSHLPVLARYGITESSLLDPCTNIYVGAWVLKGFIQRYGYTWQAVGAYNAASPHKRLAYVDRVSAALRAAQAQQRASSAAMHRGPLAQPEHPMVAYELAPAGRIGEGVEP